MAGLDMVLILFVTYGGKGELWKNYVTLHKNCWNKIKQIQIWFEKIRYQTIGLNLITFFNSV